MPRYRTMRGQVVHRRFGWDCHGLPAEVEAERELGISGHPEITAFGIAAFNDACRTSVLRYTDEWERYVRRQARWVDFEHDYKTLDLDYMESVMWAFKSLWDKGLIYEGFRVLAYCWRCETPLSNTETRMDDVYVDRQDPALTVAFELLDGPWAGARLLAWTTTPWTLPANLALAVGADITYAVVEHDGQRLVLAADRLAAYAAELGTRQPELPASARSNPSRPYAATSSPAPAYRPLFDFFTDIERFGTERAFQVLTGDFVSTDEGTGIVHMAPGFGEDDQIACNAVGIPTLVPMDEHGRYTGRGPRLGRRARLRGQPAHHPPAQGRRRRRAPRDLRPPVPALLAVLAAARLPGDLVVVRRGHQVPRSHGRAQRPDHLGARAPQARQLRQVVGERPRLVDQPQPLLGLTDPGVAQRRPRTPAGRRLRLARRAGGRLRREGRPTCTARWSTSSSGPTPTTRPAAR